MLGHYTTPPAASDYTTFLPDRSSRIGFVLGNRRFRNGGQKAVEDAIGLNTVGDRVEVENHPVPKRGPGDFQHVLNRHVQTILEQRADLRAKDDCLGASGRDTDLNVVPNHLWRA